MNIKGAIFDMDGTLLNSMVFWDTFWELMGNKYCGGNKFKPTAKEEEQMRTMTNYEVCTYLHKVYKMGESPEDVQAACAGALVDFYANKVQPKPGAIEYIEYLSSKNIPMCVASGTASDLLELVLKRFDIRKYFGNIFSCVDLGAGKEKPDIYEAALAYLGTPKDETWVFEDASIAIHTATELGLNTVGIYDAENAFQDKIRNEATLYIGEGETLMKLAD